MNTEPLDAEMRPQPLAGDTDSPDQSLRIVGLGASAGGAAALQQFFAHMPASSGLAFVVILHLAPGEERHLAALIQQVTALPVIQVAAPTPVAPDHVYLLPPSQLLSIADGTLQLQAPDGPYVRRAPIDLFFRTLADAHGRSAAAVVLSGSGADGAIGVQRVKEYGGVVLAQDPQEAEFDAMPRNAIATGLVDFILPVAAMPSTLIAYWDRAESLRLPLSDTLRRTGDADELRDIFGILRARTGHDFSQYKQATLLRRIGRRMQVCGAPDLAAYLAVVRARPEEVQALLRDLLISVTNFFRDSQAWAALESVVPDIFAGKTAGGQVRVWVAGCATGEESYSIAMLLDEYALTLDQPPDVQVFATDIDEDAILVARQGVYPETISADITPERLQRFFVPEQGRYRIRKEIRDLVLFAPHNLLHDPPFSKLDLITCRNLLIYLNRDIQEQVLRLFHFALRPGGYLLLGASESTDGVPGLFTPINKSQRLFQRRGLPSVVMPSASALPLLSAPLRAAAPSSARGADSAHSFHDLHTQLLAAHTPPSVIVNEEHEIIHLSRGAGRFLQFAEGEPSHNLLRVVRPSLRLDLRAALFAAMRGSAAQVRRVRADLGGAERLIDLVVQPILAPEWARGYTLVVFNDLFDASDIERSAASDAEPVLHQLAEELQRTKEQLRATVEQYETAVEEYRAANEELQAINEELRAATEELETSKEELQSVNEELTTVNQELKHKVDEVCQSNNDLLNLMASTEIATIFVDRNLCIKRYTPSAQAIFNLIPADINRPLAHVTHRLDYAQMIGDTARVLETLSRVEREVVSREGRTYLAYLLPYRTVEDKIDGVILTFVDITSRKLADAALRASEERLRLVVESVQDYAIFTVTPENQIDSWNTGAERMFQYTEAQMLGQDGAIILSDSGRAADLVAQELHIALREGRAEDARWYVRRDGSRFYASAVVRPIYGAAGSLRGFVKVMHDLTAQKQAEEDLRAARDDLELRVAVRTRDLAAANSRLHDEVAERKRAERARREVLRQLVTAQEEERQRIARELHDELGQQISALRLGLADLSGASPAFPEALARLQRLAAQLDDAVDQLALRLRPSALDDLGLRVALQQHVEGWAAHHGIAAEFHSAGIDDTSLPPEVEIVIYRVVQEALTNVLKHADARHVSVLLDLRAGEARVIVEDDGRGFDMDDLQRTPDPQRRLGLVGMREREALVGGTIMIETAPSRGTSVLVRIPSGPGEECSSET